MTLRPVDRLEILILVDNATDMLSSTPAQVESEAAGLMRRGIGLMASKCPCCAAHGL
jgi:7,8-dihydropterin-6-yl-methyl-4-(beta-D-ribofuranosyl)aminobenzene 5'-phosphate synthase